MADNNVNNPSSPSRFERFIGILFAFLVLALIAYTLVMETQIDSNKMLLLYVLIAIMAGAVVATIPGFLNVDYSSKGVSLRAAGGIAAFILVLSVLKELHAPNVVKTELNNPLPVQNNEAPTTVNQPPAQTLRQNFRATAYCSMTGASGYGVSTDVAQAQSIAIEYCVANGGIADCCGGNMRVEAF